jgi:hypothetical protein
MCCPGDVPCPEHQRRNAGRVSGDRSLRYITTAAGFTFCRDCGALIMAGYTVQHDRLHPPFPCAAVHPERGVFCLPDGTHPWEEVYPREPDARAATA